MRDQVNDVRTSPVEIDFSIVLSDACHTTTAVPSHDRGAPLRQIIHAAAGFRSDDWSVAVVMQIDEAGCDDQPTTVDHPHRVRGMDLAHGYDLPIADRHVADAIPVRGLVASIEQHRPLQQDVGPNGRRILYGRSILCGAGAFRRPRKRTAKQQ